MIKEEILMLTVEEGARLSRIGINRLRNIVRAEGCPFAMRVGMNRFLIKKRLFEQWLEECEAI